MFSFVFCETVPEMFNKMPRLVLLSLADKRLSFAVDGKVWSGDVIQMNGS